MSIPVNRQTLYKYIRRRTKECWRLMIRYLSITRRHILGSSKLKEFADDNFKFDENGRKLSKRLENTVGKGEIARNEQFSFSHSVFKRFVSQGRQKASLCGNVLIFLLSLSRWFPIAVILLKALILVIFLQCISIFGYR